MKNSILLDHAHKLIREKSEEDESAKKLQLFMDMTNETVGDAISDLLLVESILHARGWSVQDWNKSYQVCMCRMPIIPTALSLSLPSYLPLSPLSFFFLPLSPTHCLHNPGV